MKNYKIEMRSKARAANGLLNLLKYDIEQVTADTNDFDLICLEESIKDTKSTIQMLIDNMTELEYVLYLSKREDSRDIHSPL